MKKLLFGLLGMMTVFASQNVNAVTGVNVTAATGGAAISSDTTAGTYTALIGPSISENNPGGVGVGTIILNAPTGFVFDTTSAVTIAKTSSGPSGTDIVLSSTNAVTTATTITITVASISSGSRVNTLTYRGIKVRPTAGTPLATGNITKTGTSSYTETGSAGNYGTLTEVAGAVRHIFTTLPGETFTSGSGNSGRVATQTAGTSFDITKLTAVDQFTNIVTSYSGTKTISYTGPTGSPTYTTTVSFTSGTSTTGLATTLLKAETTTITATDGTLTGLASSPLTVQPGTTRQLQILLPGEIADAGTLAGKTGSPTPIPALNTISATVNLTDTNWNPVTSSDTVHLSSSDTQAVFAANPTLTNGVAVFSITLKTRSNTTISVSDVSDVTVNAGTSAAISVTNNAPTISTVPMLTGTLEDTALTISYATLSAQSDIADIDVNPADSLSFRVEAITTGSLTQSGTNVVAGSTLLTSSSAPLVWRPATNANGTLNAFTVKAYDGSAASTNAIQITASVAAVNDAPTFTKGADQMVLEDAGPQTVQNWATSISAGAANESTQIITFVVTNDNTALFSAQPAVSRAGTLTYTPAPNAHGTAIVTIYAQDDGGTANGGVDSTTTQTFVITVTAVNDVPTFTKGTNLLVRSTTTAQSISNWATAISAGAADESSQTLTFHLSNDNNAMFTVQPAISTNGTLTFTPATNGTATVSVYLGDDGGTANGGSDTSSTQIFTISVYPIDIAPTFSMATNLTVLEDSGVQTVTQWATNISTGAADEAGQALAFTVTNDNNSLFAVQPVLSTNGTLTFTPADNAYGSATVTVVLKDNGETNYGGSDSLTNTFVLTITPVNDAPSFTKGLDIALALTASRHQAISGWATDITAGPNEGSQSLTFLVTNDSPSVFTQQPSISADGTLTFEISPSAANVLATVSVQLSDDGGTANGGIDSSSVQTFRISLSSSYGGGSTLTTGQGPTGLFLGNLRGLTYEGATKSTGYRYRDMIIANSIDSTVSVRFCNDDGTFTDATTYPVGLNPFGVISGDFNGDGFEEIVTANFGTNTVSVLQNNTDRTFSPAIDYVVGSSSNPGPIAVMRDDFDRNGKFDLVVANYNESTVSVLLGNSDGTFGTATNFAVGSGPMSVWTADLTGDGKADIVTANKDGNTLTILPGLGNGAFGPAQTISMNGNPQPTYAVAADINGDGKIDIAVANYASNTVSILQRQANGTFQVTTNYAVGNNPRSLLIRDLDRDGKLDIAVANSGSGSITILRNRGDGTFELSGSFAVGTSPIIVWGSNFDDDDATDLAVSNYGDNTVSILRYAGPLAYNLTINLQEDHSAPIMLRGRTLNSGSLTYRVVNSPAHGALTGSVPNLVYTPTANYNGADTFQYQVTYVQGDLILDSAVATVTLKISPVNDAPIFSLASNSMTLTNFNTLQTIPGFATAISAGASDEAAQQVTFVVTGTNLALFDIQPKITSTGTLTFRPGCNKAGTAILNVRLVDNGGTLGGGTNGSATQTFTITVLPNPFVSLKGIYNGLFYESTGIANNSAGFMNLNLTDKRSFTGRLLLTGKTYSLAGTFNANGVATVTIPRTNQSALTVTLNADLTGAANDQIAGSVSDGTWTAILLGDRSTFNAVTNQAPQAGKYTLVFGGNRGDATKPSGDGLGLITVKTDGTVTVSGALADGTAFAQTTTLSKNGEWPFYVSLYNGNGLAMGWLTFTNTADSSVEGDISWIKTSAVGSKYYGGGFTNDTVAVGSIYVSPAIGSRALAVTNAITELNDGNLFASLTNTVTLATNNIATGSAPNTNSLSFAIASTTGSISGSFVNPKTKARLAIRGVVLQKQNSAYGFFLGTNQSGLFLLHP